VKYDYEADEFFSLPQFAVEENKEEKQKRLEIEQALSDPTTSLDQWRQFALTEYGLVNDDLRRKVWPLLVSIDPASVEPGPKLDDLMTHPEYNQVVLDVNRSLKRFPPGIPYEQRVALQDQLTILILRVIMKYPHLKYYQGYHDVAVTFLLVVGEEVAYSVMEVLSTHHLVECMQETMEPTQRRLMYIYPIIKYENSKLCQFLER
jgi:TBC1 domain family member 20